MSPASFNDQHSPIFPGRPTPHSCLLRRESMFSFVFFFLSTLNYFSPLQHRDKNQPCIDSAAAKRERWWKLWCRLLEPRQRTVRAISDSVERNKYRRGEDLTVFLIMSDADLRVGFGSWQMRLLFLTRFRRTRFFEW
ncbi:hypothetical protein CDAR_440831 [Caerostris darwini]|uniref:Uncharacterized protein n=1 Tax=Caerostris darwini TaxID=1538125 RepID=A0AAV4SVB2_9ARAC|nr:hypothetical protein CDAR_440831 [Caerostris darwini]